MFFAAVSFHCNDASAIQIFTVGTDVSGYTFTLLTGKKIKMSDYIGKKCVIIEFWAGYCQSCTESMKVIEEFFSEGTFQDVAYFGLVCEWALPYESAVSYIYKNNITFPQIWVKKSSPEFRPSKKKQYVSAADYALPKRVLIDKTGRVIVENREKLYDNDEIKALLYKIITKCAAGSDKLM